MSEQPVADRSVRTAWAADTDAIGAVQARALTGLYGTLLPSAIVSAIDPTEFAAGWNAAVTRPPAARNRVLVALEAGTVVGFAATSPSADDDADPTDGEIVAFHIDPGALGQGHGSRLLAAAIDTLRADGFTHARTWIIVGDDPLRHFLESAGWGPDSAHRTLGVAQPGDDATDSAPESPPDDDVLRQVRLHTDLRDDAGDAPGESEPA